MRPAAYEMIDRSCAAPGDGSECSKGAAAVARRRDRAQRSRQGAHGPAGVRTAVADERLDGFHAAIAEKVGGMDKRVQ